MCSEVNPLNHPADDDMGSDHGHDKHPLAEIVITAVLAIFDCPFTLFGFLIFFQRLFRSMLFSLCQEKMIAGLDSFWKDSEASSRTDLDALEPVSFELRQ